MVILMAKNLVIVESPTKAKTISRFLGKDFLVKSSFGHIRDLPKSDLGIDLEHDFTPRYVIPTKSKKTSNELKKAAKEAKTIYFATDEDREGEAISWHLSEILGTDPARVKRITFHEITKEAIDGAFKKPRSIDLRMVDAQQARRILDRLVGYKLSPFLWRKVARGLSAGRVQSVAVRLIVEREREVQTFVKQEYWTIEATFKTPDGNAFTAKLHAVDGHTLEKLFIASSDQAEGLVHDLKKGAFSAARVERKTIRRTPPPPYITSTLQQDGNRKLGFSAKQTMMFAQRLYEGVDVPGEGSVGLITYMRTDSVNLSEKFLTEAAEHLAQALGNEYALPSPRRFTTKSKLAQEAHEAIRPTEARRAPDALKDVLDPDQWKLYDLVWRRAMASQMPEAELEATTVDVQSAKTKASYLLRATGSVLKFPGFLAITPEGQKDTLLPKVEENDALTLESVEPKQHFTEPPPRYSDASLVKILEEHGIGRPSTYAPTIATIQDRGYVERIEGRRLKPTEIAFLVNDLLVEHFPEIVDFQFTAKMEEDLDGIAEGEKKWVPVVREFWEPFSALLAKKEGEIIKKEIAEEPTDVVCDKCGKPMVIKTGRFGRFLACTGSPDCRNTRPLAEGGKEAAERIITEEICPECNKEKLEIVEGRYGKYLRCTNYPDCKGHKPLQKGTGVPCPKCAKGEIVEKRTRRGKNFYACNQYPNCDFALWSKPAGEKCPKCGSLIVYGAKGTLRCSSKECDYSQAAETA